MHWSTLDKIRCQMRQYKCNANRWWRNCIRTWSSGIRGMVINMVMDVRNRSKMTVVTHPCFEWRMRLNLTLSRMSLDASRICCRNVTALSISVQRSWWSVVSKVNKSNEAVCILTLSLSAAERCLLKVLCGMYGVKALEQNIMTLSAACLRCHDCFQLSHFLLWIVTCSFQFWAMIWFIHTVKVRTLWKKILRPAVSGVLILLLERQHRLWAQLQQN